MNQLPERARGNVAEWAEVEDHYDVWVSGITVAHVDTQEEAEALVAFLDEWPQTRTTLVSEAYDRNYR